MRLGLVNIGRFVALMVWPGNERQVGARIGKAAVRARTMSESTRRSIITSRLPVNAWPERDLRITAVDGETGDLSFSNETAAWSLSKPARTLDSK